MANVYLFLLLFLSSFALQGQTVQTQYGPVTGQLNGAVYEFLGIPFASPPVDSLRWRPTAAPAPWTSPIMATQFPPKCPQKRYEQGQPDSVFTLEGDEDCLYLNVWSPDTAGSYPVMLFIHGGGNQQGSTGQISAGTEIYHGKNLSERGDVVVVTIQYRLGALGYLVHPGLEEENPQNISGNYAVMDQLFALEWVQSNIAAFGGNPGNVTLFGESGGGVNVGNLLTVSQANGLFHRAIIQSATPVINAYDTAKVEGIDFVDSFIASGTNSAKISYMRQIPADSLSIRNQNPLEGGVVQMAWQPVLDQQIFYGYPTDVFQSGNFNQVPLMIGSNADEMRALAPQTVFPFMVTGLINRLVPFNLRSTALALYPPGSSNAEAKESYAGILTDVQFTVNARRTAQCVSLNQSAPVYRYFFSHSHNPSIPVIGDLGAYHGIELFYIFNNWENSPYAIGPWFTAQDDSVQEASLKYWTNFAKNGDPNGGQLPQWPVYTAATDPYLEIKASPDGSLNGLRAAKCDLWDSAAGFSVCSGGPVTNAALGVEGVSLVVAPNPSGGVFVIHGLEEDSFNVEVFSLAGQKVLSASNSRKINLSGEKNGIYFVLVHAGGEVYSTKILKVE